MALECSDVTAVGHEREGQFGSIVLDTSVGELRIANVRDRIASRAAGRIRDTIAALG
jgi:hypothetical protein